MGCCGVHTARWGYEADDRCSCGPLKKTTVLRATSQTLQMQHRKPLPWPVIGPGKFRRSQLQIILKQGMADTI